MHTWNAIVAAKDKLAEAYLTYFPKPPHKMIGARYVDMWHIRFVIPRGARRLGIFPSCRSVLAQDPGPDNEPLREAAHSQEATDARSLA
jgi:hypothetical protein